jgi:KDO2-lipid IV(A) lauroyltransferase
MSELAAALLYALAWTVARLPWPLLRLLADGVARLSIATNAREARVARRNLELIRPDLDTAARDALLREILRTTARQAFETLRLWTRPASRNLADIAEVHGEALFDAALAGTPVEGRRGLIVAAPHMGNWELLNQWLAMKTPLAILYRPPESAIGEAFLRRVRANAGGDVEQVRAEAAGVRTLLKRLQKGGVVGILPDQQPKAGEGEFAPFFGKPALTMTLLGRLAARSDAQVLLAWCERLPGTSPPRFALHVQAAPDALGDADPVRAVEALNAAIESVARRDFGQYQWTYKRYTLRPPGSGEANPYLDLYR